MSTAIVSLADSLSLFSDPKLWQQAVAKLPDNLKSALPKVAGIDLDLLQLQKDIRE